MSEKTSVSEDVVKVEFDRGVAWVTLNRPEKRNALNPALNKRMLEIIDELEGDERCGVFVLTGAGEAWSAGMDLKEYFRDNDDKPREATLKARRQAAAWGNRLQYFEKPTIAMVNGWCFGGAFMPLVCCDLAIAADEAKFGLSEINWGILPGGNVTRAVAEVMSYRDGLYYIMTGELFDGRKAAEAVTTPLNIKAVAMTDVGKYRLIIFSHLNSKLLQRSYWIITVFQSSRGSVALFAPLSDAFCTDADDWPFSTWDGGTIAGARRVSLLEIFRLSFPWLNRENGK